MSDKTKKELTPEEMAKVVKMAGRGPVEAILDQKSDLLKLTFDEINKLSFLLERVAGNGCCSGIA